jgi:hypothetical protein
VNGGVRGDGRRSAAVDSSCCRKDPCLSFIDRLAVSEGR